MKQQNQKSDAKTIKEITKDIVGSRFTWSVGELKKVDKKQEGVNND